MSRYIRPAIPGASIFFTVTLSVRGSRLLVEEIARLRAAVRATMAERPFHVDAWVVLPDHMHAVWTLPEGDSGYAVRWGAIKARFTHGVRQAEAVTWPRFPVVRAGQYAGVNPGLRQDKGEVALWQRRFWEHPIRDEADFNAHVRYCWNNPVKHGFTARAVDWPYSSIHRDMRLGRVDPEWAGVILHGIFGE
ncbi:MAG: REP-associated tyrosine transposase [Pseudomonadota bacterium]|uniref:REP-associated tyrosine transposase n=1 Tax=Roseovarius TaxID=74030 RepID=UPI0022A8B7FE|nr:transposase [Roseovarius sp. EGI FJ00037]MCZ0812425.1 transposase [Roseovarius sp. EGI FJ00037]